MITVHVIYGEMTTSRVRYLKKWGINVEKGFNRIDLLEDDLYFLIKPYLEEWNFSDFPMSKFDNTELDNAKFLQIYPNWQPYYPEPAENSEYLALTYETTNYCRDFGTGLTQKAPFRIKSEPKWGKKQALMLYWIYDEIFVKKETYDKIFQPIGINFIPVLKYKKDTLIDSIVQLVIPQTEISLNLDDYPKVVSKKRGEIKYGIINHGFFPNFIGDIPSSLQIFRSKEYFFGGVEARKMIFVTQTLRQTLIREKVNMSYYPLKIDF